MIYIRFSIKNAKNYVCTYLQRGRCEGFLWHGFVWRAQAIAFHIWGSHSVISEIERSTCKEELYSMARDRFLVFNAPFNNISVISWQSVLLVEETGVPGEKTHQSCIQDRRILKLVFKDDLCLIVNEKTL